MAITLAPAPAAQPARTRRAIDNGHHRSVYAANLLAKSVQATPNRRARPSPPRFTRIALYDKLLLEANSNDNYR